MSIETISSALLFEGRVFDVRRDRVRFPDGHLTDLDSVLHNGAVTIVPIDDNDHVWFVYQYRHTIHSWLLELPAGSIEDGEIPLECAQREIQEEIGMAAGYLELIGEFFLAPGYSKEYMYVFLAINLYPKTIAADQDELIEVKRYPIRDVLSMLDSGVIKDAKSLVGLHLAKAYFDMDD